MISFSTRVRRVGVALAAATAVSVGVSACSGSATSPTSIKLVAYSVPKPAYDALATAFAKTSEGKGVKFTTSYGPSGTQSKNVLGGQKADYVGFSVEPDMTKLVPTKVSKDWNRGATKGIVSHSVVVIVVRKGNPRKITGWDDLIKPGVQIVTPDPASSGSAKWNLLAAYAHVLAKGGSAADASAYLKQFFAHVKSRASSGAIATTQITSGTGNVLISYENEAIAAKQAGKSVDYVVPEQSILIENPVAVTTKASKAAKSFLAFAESTRGQQIFAAHGFRPVSSSVQVGTVKGANDPANPFPAVKQLYTVAELGGWGVVNDKFFGDNGIVTKIEAG